MKFLPECVCEQYTWVILPVPYEETTSFLKGTAQGPDAILRMSDQLEVYDPMLQAAGYADVGVHTDEGWNPDGQLLEIGKRIEFWLEKGKKVLSLGGEHTITLPIVKVYQKYFENMAVLHLDAHADLRDNYDGTHLSHACVVRRLLEHVPVYSLGIRTYSSEEADYIRDNNFPILHSHEINEPGRLERFLHDLPDTLYLSLDVDVLDPSIVPTVGTPHPGGMNYEQITRIVDYLAENQKVIGADLVEARPVPGLEYGIYTIASLCHYMLSRFR